MTLINAAQLTLLGPLMQLVLFLGIVGTDALPLSECTKIADIGGRRQEEDTGNRAQISSGQLPLFQEA
jgi:hypothetical protein